MFYYTKNTKIIGKINNIDSSYIKNLNIYNLDKWHNYANINNELYYYKIFNFNELIGEYLCRYLNLDSVHNELVLKNNQLYLASKSFIEDKYNYYMSKYEDFDKLLDRCINNDNRKEMIESHMKLFAIDLYMNQSDRDKPSNITYKVDKASKYISMTKVYDFSNSFTDISCYSNPYFEFEFDRAEFYNFFKIYPKLKIYLEKLYGVDLYYIICSILNDYKLEISDKTFIFYEKYDKNKRKVLESILDV